MSGVNITCGLPIIRVSVDHGTAFGKAGEGRANPESMIQAIKIAAKLALRSCEKIGHMVQTERTGGLEKL